jgi:hypothetical protein
MRSLHKATSQTDTDDQRAFGQEQNAKDLFIESSGGQWWTREAFRRAYFKRFGKDLAIASASRILSNLSANNGTLEKSTHPLFDGGEGVKVHAWRVRPNPGQAALFCETVNYDPLDGGLR